MGLYDGMCHMKKDKTYWLIAFHWKLEDILMHPKQSQKYYNMDYVGPHYSKTFRGL